MKTRTLLGTGMLCPDEMLVLKQTNLASIWVACLRVCVLGKYLAMENFCRPVKLACNLSTQNPWSMGQRDGSVGKDTRHQA